MIFFFDKNSVQIPSFELPEFYSVSHAIPEADGSLSELDKQRWLSLHPEERWKNVKVPSSAAGVIFSYFRDEPVGCFVVNLKRDRAIFEHAQNDPAHRRKGLYKAMMITGLRYAMSIESCKYIYAVPIQMLEPFWNKIGNTLDPMPEKWSFRKNVKL